MVIASKTRVMAVATGEVVELVVVTITSAIVVLVDCTRDIGVVAAMAFAVAEVAAEVAAVEDCTMGNTASEGSIVVARAKAEAEMDYRAMGTMTLAASDFTVAMAASEASSIKGSKASMAMDLAKKGDKMA